MLDGRGHGGDRIGGSGEMHARHEVVTPAAGEFDPMPADGQRALATKPLRIHPATCAVGNHGRAVGDQRQRGAGQDTTPAVSGVRRTAHG